MLILDTNVISETMRVRPDQKIVDWIDAQANSLIWTTSVTVFEILAGIERLPKGKRRQNLKTMFELSLVEDFCGRIVDFDTSAATAAASISARLHRMGHTVEIRDLEIAGIVLSRHATLVTRNVKDFVHTGVQLINPWEDAAQ